ncbi:hypothetical protein [Streptomyces ortus]|uniref:DUF4131 domain-containing protein n=1 Tax=Streptomyces ortus TaxID=2867268 RepID=A0ABT3V9L6_9ACTN|nr:hypothetical protein [Streptomyces ortus]MCX4236634.1 DUF4131 domain-containing protein [Streptomyces ortus]
MPEYGGADDKETPQDRAAQNKAAQAETAYDGAPHEATAYEATAYEATAHDGTPHDEPPYDQTASGGIDALLVAITDEPLPAGARDDPRFMARHRSAVADVALLREQLRVIGDTLADDGPRAARAPSPGRPAPRAPAPPGAPKQPTAPHRPHRSRRYAGAAVGALVIAAGTTLLGGLVWLGVQGGGGGAADSDAGAKSDSSAGRSEDSGGDTSSLSPEMRLACSKVLAEGTVRSVTSTGEGNVRVVLEVRRYYRPEQPVADHPTVTVTLPGAAREDLKPGTYALVRVPLYPRDPLDDETGRPDYETGRGVGDAREEIVGALSGARGLECAGPEGDRG